MPYPAVVVRPYGELVAGNSFATAVDVTLAELHLEAFLPADEHTARILGSHGSW
jgi:hypothetical protein